MGRLRSYLPVYLQAGIALERTVLPKAYYHAEGLQDLLSPTSPSLGEPGLAVRRAPELPTRRSVLPVGPCPAVYYARGYERP